MQIDQWVTLTVFRLVGRMLRKIALTAVMIYFVVIAIYYFGAAVMVALSLEYGLVNAQLIVGGIYTALAVICFIVLWSMGAKRATMNGLTAGRSREALISMLIEALMLGYQLARKRDRDR